VICPQSSSSLWGSFISLDLDENVSKQANAYLLRFTAVESIESEVWIAFESNS
jgi:hypothetical protein